jgi:pimeloyl-ACP methyl ester carboxylesterase
VLAIPPAGWGDRPELAERYQHDAAQLRSQGMDSWATSVSMAQRPPILAAEPNLPAAVPRVLEEWLPAVLRGAAASDLPPAEQVSQLTQPALILAWDTDPAHPLSTAYQLAELLPRADLYIARTARQIEEWPHLVAGFLGMGV